MRASLFSLLAVLPLSAAAQQTWVESSATVALTLTHQSATTVAATSGGGSRRTTKLLRFRLGNREILQAMVAEGIIPSITGWKLVALWNDWDDDERGPCFRYHVKRGKGSATELIPAPNHLLTLTPVLPVVSYKHTRDADDTIIAGTEKFEVLHEFFFDLAGHGGLAGGMEKGSGRYTTKHGATTYLPGASNIIIAGAHNDGNESTDGLVAGTLKFSAAKIMTVSDSSGAGTSVGATTGIRRDIVTNPLPIIGEATSAPSGTRPMIMAEPRSAQLHWLAAEYLAQLRAEQANQQPTP